MSIENVLKSVVGILATAAVVVTVGPRSASAAQTKTCNATVSSCCECSIDGGEQVCEKTTAKTGVDTCVIEGTTCPSGNTCDRNT